jgi:hypothetical protein
MTDEEFQQIEILQELTYKLLKDIKSLRQYFDYMGNGIVEDKEISNNPLSLFRLSFVIGYSRAILDLQTGRLNIKMITLDLKGKKHEDKESDNPLLRRNKATGNGKLGQVDDL